MTVSTLELDRIIHSDDVSSVDSSSCHGRSYSDGDRSSRLEQETIIKSLNYVVQRLAESLELKDEELHVKDHVLKNTMPDLLKENAQLRNKVANLQKGGPAIKVGTEEKEKQRTPATSCDLSSEEELFDCETAIVHLLASHCSVISSSSRNLVPSFPSNERSTSSGMRRDSLHTKASRIGGSIGIRRKQLSRRGRRPLGWIFSPFVPRRVIINKEQHSQDVVSDLSSCT